ncbi:MAG: DUF2625 family protein [Clostridiaceae bacterium]
MKQINELIDENQAGWKLIEEWLTEAENKVEILKTTKSKAEEVLYDLQVTTKSPLGAIAYNTGGILVNNGWIRILGSGTKDFKRDISNWNNLNAENLRLEKAFLVADDILGGFFAINGGLFEGEIGHIFYLAPDTLQWENLEIWFSEFIHWTFVGDLNKFYELFMWPEWENEVKDISIDFGISIYPFLWAEGEEVEKRSRKVVPIEELWNVTIDNRKRLGIV